MCKSQPTVFLAVVWEVALENVDERQSWKRKVMMLLQMI